MPNHNVVARHFDQEADRLALTYFEQWLALRGNKARRSEFHARLIERAHQATDIERTAARRALRLIEPRPIGHKDVA